MENSILIALTGKIASGKSRLKQYFPDNVIYMDLDSILSPHVDYMIANFLFDEFELDVKDVNVNWRKFIVDNVLFSPVYSPKYLKLFQSTIQEQLHTCRTVPGIYVVESSALYQYTDIIRQFDHIISLKTHDTIYQKNLKQRSISANDPRISNYMEIPGSYRLTLNTGSIMETRGKIELILSNILNPEVLEWITEFESIKEERWNYNSYHNKDHTRCVLSNYFLSTLESGIDDNVVQAIINHDIGYNPKLSNNEEYAATFVDGEARELILSTKNYNSSSLSPIMEHDLKIFTRENDEYLEYEKLIRKEYVHVPYDKYVTSRSKFLQDYYNRGLLPKHKYELSLDYMKSYNPTVGLFCGSFDPFTVGHQDIRDKAEKMFNEVVLVIAQNPNKKHNNIKSDHPNFCTTVYIPDLIRDYIVTPTLIRGVRNSEDYRETIEWHSQIEMLLGYTVPLCIIPCMPKLSHVSSSLVKNVTTLNDSSDVKKLIGDWEYPIRSTICQK